MSSKRRPDQPLRTGWTTGACATAATKAAFFALHGRGFLDPVTITLPKGQMPSFALADKAKGTHWAMAAVVKDAGDDPDVTHGALIQATLRFANTIQFVAGEGVGTVTKPGLPIEPGQAAINPVPRRMIRQVIEEAANELCVMAGAEVTLSIPGGRELAAKTWNPRLGIEGGLSILGTTGIVRPFSCAAWIASIHRGIDVARASHLTHVVGSTGNLSEAAAKSLYPLPDHAFLDMGDFIGGMLKYLRRHPLPRLTISGGFAKMSKYAQGADDLHSSRSQVDINALAALMPTNSELAKAKTAMHALELAGPDIARSVAIKAADRARAALPGTHIDILITDRQGRIAAQFTQEP